MPEGRVLVAVVSYNTRDLLDRCLRSLQGRADVWVVDNASADGSAEMVRSAHPWARLVASEENLGFGRAVNLVASRSSSPWLAAANADVAVSGDALERLVRDGERFGSVGALAPRLVLPDGSTQPSSFTFPSVVDACARALGADRFLLPRALDPERPREVPWAVGAFLLVRRSAFDAVGGFDEAQWMYAEDLDLGWRLREAGWTTRYVPDARVLHEEAASTTAAFGEERTERWQRSTYAWIAARRGTGRARAVAAVNVSSCRARAAIARGRERERWRWWAGVHARAARDAVRDAAARAPGSAAGGRARTPSG